MSDRLIGDKPFADWSRLAKQDPAGFEAERRRVVEEWIGRAPLAKQQRLRRMQWRIDQVRRLSANPLAAYVRLSRMMCESIASTHGVISALEDPCRLRKTPGELLPLPRKEKPISGGE